MKALLLASMLFVSPALALDVCEHCEKAKLCSPHALAQKTLLGGLKAELAKGDVRDRVEALSAVAELTFEHENCRTKAVAKALIAALDDPALRVRTKVLGMLVDGQHAESTVSALVGRLGDIKRNMWGLVEWLRGKQGVHGSADDALGYTETLMEVSGEVPDDRVVKALAYALKAMPTEMRGQPVAMAATRSLLELGTRDAVKTVIKQFSPRPPSRGAVENIHGALEDFAIELEIEEYPDFTGDIKSRWERWAKKNSSRIPAKLGRWRGKSFDD